MHFFSVLHDFAKTGPGCHATVAKQWLGLPFSFFFFYFAAIRKVFFRHWQMMNNVAYLLLLEVIVEHHGLSPFGTEGIK